MGNVGGQEWDVSVVQLRQRGLAAASWVGGRRRATRKEVELGGRELRWQEKDHQRLRMQKRERGDDTVGDRSLRSRTGEAALETAIGAGGEDTCTRQCEKEKRQPQLSTYFFSEREYVDNCGSERTCAHTKTSEKEKRQPQLSLDSWESSDNCGSERRRVHEKTRRKAGENTMMERLEGDEMIE